jgi:hypothetical protein
MPVLLKWPSTLHHRYPSHILLLGVGQGNGQQIRQLPQLALNFDGLMLRVVAADMVSENLCSALVLLPVYIAEM